MTVTTHRIYGLDILRAFAILFVLVGHGNVLLKTTSFYKGIYLFVFDGVQIFFVLSGFLIGGILIKLIKKKGVSFQVIKGFWIRRWLRTLPNYYFVLCLLILIYHQVTLSSAKRYFVFSQNLLWPHPPFFPEAWSLAVEEWFYLLLPLMLLVLTRLFRFRNKQTLLIAIVFVCVISIIYRWYLFDLHDITTWNQFGKIVKNKVSTQLDCLMYGVVGAYLRFYHIELWHRHKKILFGIGIAILIAVKISLSLVDSDLFGQEIKLFHAVFSFSLGSVGVLLLLPLLSSITNGSGKLYTFFTFISAVSYSLYLVHHTFVLFYLVPIFQRYISLRSSDLLSTILTYLCYWVLSIIIAYVLYLCIEQPFMKYRDTYFR